MRTPRSRTARLCGACSPSMIEVRKFVFDLLQGKLTYFVPFTPLFLCIFCNPSDCQSLFSLFFVVDFSYTQLFYCHLLFFSMASPPPTVLVIEINSLSTFFYCNNTTIVMDCQSSGGFVFGLACLSVSFVVVVCVCRIFFFFSVFWLFWYFFNN